jgi:hypothetical protein
MSAAKWSYRRNRLDPSLTAIYCEPETGEMPMIIVSTDADRVAVAEVKAARKEQHNGLWAWLPGLGVVADLVRRAGALATPVAVAGTTAIVITSAGVSAHLAATPLTPGPLHRTPLSHVTQHAPESELILDPPSVYAARWDPVPTAAVSSPTPSASPTPRPSPSPTPTPEPTVTVTASPSPTPSRSRTRHPRHSQAPAPPLETITVSPTTEPPPATTTPTADPLSDIDEVGGASPSPTP